MNQGLCCCEYKSETGDLNHLLACCCNCQALDETCDSILCCRGVPSGSCARIGSTLADRVRIPCCDGRGARKINLEILYYSLVFISPLLILLLWTQGPLTIAVSIFCLFAVYLKSSSVTCFLFGLFSMVWLVLLMQFVILTDLTITFGEHFVLMCGVGSACACGHFIRTRAMPKDYLGNKKYAQSLRHSFWLSCSVHSGYCYCIFLLAVVLSCGYYADLAMTNVCTFWIPTQDPQGLLLPYDCSLAFSDFWKSLKMSGGLYALSMAAAALISLVMQVTFSLRTFKTNSRRVFTY